MSTNVIVTGLPGETTFSKLVYKFKTILKKIQIKQFWIREVCDMYGSGCKQMTVGFTSNTEARKARNYLNNMAYNHGPEEYKIMASIDDESSSMAVECPPEEEEWGRSRRPTKRGRPRTRSPSPGYSREANKLDMEIELLRKQRQVIEEERRLLLEQKKLEMIREFGPSASRDFDRFEDHLEPPQKRHHPSVVEKRFPPRKRSPHPPKPKQNVTKNGPKGLPLFFQPCKKLISEMKEFLEKDTSAEEKDILIKLLRAAIRKNLAIALDGKEYMPTGEILKLYRQLHPKSMDESFVSKILANIRASYLPDVLEGKVAILGTDSEQKKNENLSKTAEVDNDIQTDIKDEVDVKHESEDNKAEENSEFKQAGNDETEPEDNPANKENGTDAEPTDGGVILNLKPDVTQDVISPEETPDGKDEPATCEDTTESVEGNAKLPENDAIILNPTSDVPEDVISTETTPEGKGESATGEDALTELVEGKAETPENGETTTQ